MDENKELQPLKYKTELEEYLKKISSKEQIYSIALFDIFCSQTYSCTGFSRLTFVTYLATQIDVLGSKNAQVYIIVERLS
ncbi:hypothetical protein, partial [Diplocloster agilis]|uniref:hypothetical protein n=1 Tax=Diplocloster agilis TaxID=2850323 RepID=UPI002265C985